MFERRGRADESTGRRYRRRCAVGLGRLPTQIPGLYSGLQMREGIEIASCIEQKKRLLVEFQLRPGEGFCKFFWRAESTGKCDVALSALGHGRFARVHGVNYDKFTQARVGPFPFDHSAWNNAYYPSPAVSAALASAPIMPTAPPP